MGAGAPGTRGVSAEGGALLEALAALAASDDPASTVERAACEAARLLGAAASAAAVDATGRTLRGLFGPFEERAGPDAERRIRERLRVAGSPAVLGPGEGPESGTGTLVAAALSDRRGGPMGWLAVALPDLPDDDEHVTDAAATLLAGFASAASAAIDRILTIAELEHANRQRQAFFGVVSHELRTPITTIYGGTRVLRQSAARLSHDARQQLLEDVAQEAERLYRLVEDLLVLSRAEREALVVAAEPILVQHLVARVAESEQQRWPRTRFAVTTDRGLPPVLGDSTLIEQVIRNLLSNAAKYAGEAGPVEIRATAAGEWVEVRVLDVGPGVELDDPERVFELFYRGPDAASRAQGAGIGLYACRELVRAMGGDVWVRVRASRGTEFGFRLRSQGFDDEADALGGDGR